MSFIEVIIKSLVFLICPLAIYMLYTIYKRNMSIEEKDIAFELSVFSSLYLILRYDCSFYKGYPIIIFDIPLLICYYKRKIGLSVFISIILIIYQYLFLNLNLTFLVFEYISYLTIYTFIIKKKIKPISIVNIFIVIKSFMLSLSVFWFIKPENTYISNLIYLFSIILVLYFVTNLIIYFFAKGEKIVDLSNDLEKIEKEKELRSSLFKVTHEIKNPIAVCKGYLDMIDVNDSKQVKKYIPIMQDEVKRLLILLQDFLCINKIKINKDILDINLLLEEVIGSLKSGLMDYEILIDMELYDDDIYVNGDYNRLTQVFVNLVKNSIEARKEFNSFIKISSYLENDYVVIEVYDNGYGIEKDILDKIGEPFFTTKKRGSGLGVSLSQEIIEAHNGIIKYASIPQEYTLVTIKLPLYEKDIKTISWYP